LQILHDALPNVDVIITSQFSPLLANALVKGKLDAALLRRKEGMPELAFRLLIKEPLVVVSPSDYRLAGLRPSIPGPGA
jgi:LysR family hca operon transcriptional activator